MRKITAIFFFLLLFPAIFPKSPIIGGVNSASAAEAYPERAVFAVTIENNTSKVTTVMTVFAENEQDAHDQVALNGWTVVGVKRLTEKEVKQFDLSADSVNSVTPGNVRIESLMKDGPPGDSALKSGRNGTEDTAGYPPITRTPDKPASAENAAGADVADNLDLLPSSPELEFIAAYYYELGRVEPVSNPISDGRMSGFDKNAYYVVFGHADEVPVGGNAPYGSNFELSFKRAEYVRGMMARAGVPAGQIRVVGLGTNYPVAKNAKDGSLANRRVEIYGFRGAGRK